MSNCKLCLADCAFSGKDMKKGTCKGYIPMTNSDRIRAMSDEELAKAINLLAEGESVIQYCRHLPECDEDLERDTVIPLAPATCKGGHHMLIVTIQVNAPPEWSPSGRSCPSR